MVLSLLSACAVFPCALPTLQYTLSICLLRSEKMKKGGVAREIKGCRRRCLHHPAPTSAGKRGAKGAREREKERERKREREDRRDERHTHDTPRCGTPHTTHRIAAGTRARWYARHTLSSPLAARVIKARALTTLTLYDTARDRGYTPATTRNIRPLPIPLPLTSCYVSNEKIVPHVGRGARRRVGDGTRRGGSLRS